MSKFISSYRFGFVILAALTLGACGEKRAAADGPASPAPTSVPSGSEVGPKGDTGSPGIPGVAGATGATGATGAAGANGTNGINGTDGTNASTAGDIKVIAMPLTLPPLVPATSSYFDLLDNGASYTYAPDFAFGVNVDGGLLFFVPSLSSGLSFSRVAGSLCGVSFPVTGLTTVAGYIASLHETFSMLTDSLVDTGCASAGATGLRAEPSSISFAMSADGNYRITASQTGAHSLNGSIWQINGNQSSANSPAVDTTTTQVTGYDASGGGVDMDTSLILPATYVSGSTVIGVKITNGAPLSRVSSFSSPVCTSGGCTIGVNWQDAPIGPGGTAIAYVLAP